MKQRRVITLAVFVAFVLAAYLLLRRFLPMDSLVAQEDRLRHFVDSSPVVAWLLGLGVYFVVALVPGTGGKAFVAGWLFGFLPGLLIVNLALTAAALTSFLVIRYAFQSAAHRRMGGLIRRVDHALGREGAFFLLTLRLAHAPYTITNYASGATTVPVSTFWWTTQLGMLPGNVVFVLAGSQLPSLRAFVERGPWSLVNWPLLAALSLTALVPLAIRSALGRRQHDSTARPTASTPPDASHAKGQ